MQSGGRRTRGGGSLRNSLSPHLPPPFETRGTGSPHGSPGSGTLSALRHTHRGRRPAARPSGSRRMAELSCGASAAAAPASSERRREARRSCGELTQCQNWGADPVGRSPWGSDEPTEMETLLEKCVAQGFVSQETLDSACEEFECFVRFEEREKMANIRAEINEKKLETELLQLEMEAADIVHPFHLSKKYQLLQDVNRHLEAVLKGKKRLRQRLIKPVCQETLPIKADFHKYVVELLTEAVTFIEKLENHLQTAKMIPQVPTFMKNLDIALTKTEVMVTDLEELTEQILQWREVQKEAYSDSICNTAGLDLGLST
ncbi:HAUS augmin-like complex subunit 2 [Excalfactoria chinensis]|uniref:HAUS augmin-like complex subunit 2 n=1 Tax=Excalfactoria chinensis TaxID=46218 RepID=UPI003B3B98C9